MYAAAFSRSCKEHRTTLRTTSGAISSNRAKSQLCNSEKTFSLKKTNGWRLSKISGLVEFEYMYHSREYDRIIFSLTVKCGDAAKSMVSLYRSIRNFLYLSMRRASTVRMYFYTIVRSICLKMKRRVNTKWCRKHKIRAKGKGSTKNDEETLICVQNTWRREFAKDQDATGETSLVSRGNLLNISSVFHFIISPARNSHSLKDTRAITEMLTSTM